MRLARITCERISRGVVTGGCSQLAAASLLLKFKAPYDPLSFLIFFTYIIAISINFIKLLHQKKLTLLMKVLIS